MARHQSVRGFTLLISILIGLCGFWFGARDVIGYPGKPTIVGSLSVLVAMMTLLLVALQLVRKQSPPSLRRWPLFLLMAAVGYFIAKDSFSHVLYLWRPGGLPGGCYTQLEVWLKVPRESWIRSAEQIASVSLFFGSPLALLVGRPEPNGELAIDGA